MDDRFKVSLCLGAALLCIGLAGAGVHVFSGRWERTVPTTLAGPALSLRLNENASLHGKNGLAVQNYGYISGAVTNPGMYPISEDARVFDLVKAAGGLRHDADTGQINLAAPIRDGAHVHIKEKFAVFHTRSKENTKTRNSGRKENVSSSLHYVYINTATAEELCALPGIGPSLAKRIIDYKQSHGTFHSADELLDVPGIGKSKLNTFRSLLRF